MFPPFPLRLLRCDGHRDFLGDVVHGDEQERLARSDPLDIEFDGVLTSGNHDLLGVLACGTNGIAVPKTKGGRRLHATRLAKRRRDGHDLVDFGPNNGG